MKEIRNVIIFGAGAMGAVYAARFIDAPRFSTALIARNPRYDRLRAHGLVVNGKHYSVPVIQPDAANEPADLIILALKHHDLPEALDDLKGVANSETTFISVMNGLDSEEYLGAAFGMDRVLYAMVVGIDAVREGNSVIYSNLGKMVFGEPSNSNPSERVLRVQEAFQRADIAFETPPDMMRSLWWKFMINVGVNQTSAVTRATYGVFQSSPDTKALTDALMREVISVAQRIGINLEEHDLEGWYDVLKKLSPDGKTSMLQDIEAGRKTEVEAFAGKMVKLGKLHNVPTPVNQVMLNIIHVLEQPRV